MESKVFSSPVIRGALRDGLVAVQVDTVQRGDLADQFQVETVPRDIVVYPDGNVATLSVGYVPMPSYLAILRDTAARGRMLALDRMDEKAAREKPVPRQRPGSPLTRTDEDRVAANDAGSRSSRNRDPFAIPEPKPANDVAEGVIGLSGFCPVRLTADRDWVKGNKRFTEQYRGVTYRLSSREEQDRFRRDPAKYAPKNLGCDPVLLLSDQRAVTGRIRYGAFFDDQLYLFRTAQTRTEFKSNPLKYTRIQHAIRPSVLTGQTFR